MTNTTQRISDALSEALATMAFIDIVDAEDAMESPTQLLFGEIHFSGPTSGMVHVLVGMDFAKAVAENMGALDEVDDAIRLDALREVCNVTCGLLLPGLADSPDDVFDVSVPIARVCDDSQTWDGFTACGDWTVVNAEGHPVAVKLLIE